MNISIDTKVDKNPTPVHDKTPQQVRNRGKLPQLNKIIYKKPTATSYLLVKSECFTPSIRNRQLFLNIALEVLASSIRQEKEMKMKGIRREEMMLFHLQMTQWSEQVSP